MRKGIAWRGREEGKNVVASGIAQSPSREESLEEAVARLERGGAGDLATYASLLRRCGRERDLARGRRVHVHILSSGRDDHVFLSNLLLQMYGWCGSAAEARSVFEILEERRNLYSWSAMIAAYSHCGQSREALALFQRMDCEGVRANGLTFVALLGACCRLRDLAQGQRAHHRIECCGSFSSNIAVANSLLTMYARCGWIDRARRVFDAMHLRNVVSWNAMIGAYSRAGLFQEALDLFDGMAVEPDRLSFTAALGACAGLGDLSQGRAIHAMISTSAHDSDALVGTALLNFYSKLACVIDARRVFDRIARRDAIAWSAMIAAYAQNGHCHDAIALFRCLDHEGAAANEITFVSAVDACSGSGDLVSGKKLHARILELGFHRHITVKNTLLNLYSKLGSLDDAEELFAARGLDRNTESWNAMLAAFTRHGQPWRAIQALELMDLEGTNPNEVTLSTIFDACAETGDLAAGRKIHARIRGTELERDLAVANSLISMYSRCWSLIEAESVFQRMDCRDLISWNSLIAAYAMHGHPAPALELFRLLVLEGFLADDFTFSSTLFACSHAGLLQESVEQFATMVADHSAVPSPQHYGCVLDLLGRLGKLGDAEDLIGGMPLEPDTVAWMALLGACNTHSDFAKASSFADNLFRLEPRKAAAFVMLTNVKSGATESESSIDE